MNLILAVLLLFGAVDVKTAQKGDLYDDSVVVTNVDETAFVKWGTTSGKILRIDGGYVSPTVATGGVDLVGSALNVKGSAQYPAKVTYWPKNMSNRGAYAVFASGTGIYFPKSEDVAAASVYGLQAGYESLDERLTRKFGGVFTLDTDSGSNKTALRIGSRASGTVAGPYSSIFGYSNEASAQGAFAGGYESAAGGVYDFAWGRSARASAGYATALGFRPNATNETAFVWQGSALYGEGLYGSHGKGTFNVSPVNGYSGFYVGSQSLADKFAQYVPMTGTPPGRGLTGNIAFNRNGSYFGEIGLNNVTGAAMMSSQTNFVYFTSKAGGLTREATLFPDNTRILTQAYAKDAYPILTNAYTKNEIDGSVLKKNGDNYADTGFAVYAPSRSGGPTNPVVKLENYGWRFGGKADSALSLSKYDDITGTNLEAAVSWYEDGNSKVYVIKDANHTNAEAIASIADIDRKIAQGGGGGGGGVGGGGITNRIESVDRLNAIYADGSWVTRTNATAGVAVTNTICTVSNVVTTVVTTVNEVKRKFYDTPLQVEWRFEAVNGEFMMIATTNVNTEVIQ